MDIHQELQYHLYNGNITEIENIMNNISKYDKKLIILKILLFIFHQEINAGANFTVFDYSLDFDELAEHYVETKLLMRRLEFGLPQFYIDDFYHYIINTCVSDIYITYIIKNNIFHKKRVCQQLSSLFNSHNEAERGKLYNELSKIVENSYI